VHGWVLPYERASWRPSTHTSTRSFTNIIWFDGF
jgi:hypothetical protein